MGQYKAALDKIAALLPVRERVQGENHPNVQKTRDLITKIEDSLSGRKDDDGAGDPQDPDPEA